MKNCLNCGKELTGRQTKYCSNNCQKEYEHKQWVERWKAGKETGMSGKYGISNHLKKYLLDKYGHKCARCGWGKINPFTYTLPLEVEHIDGDYTNNAEDNLILLCPNCHSLTATYKGANKGKGRKDRKQYSLYANPEQDEKSCVETLQGEPKE